MSLWKADKEEQRQTFWRVPPPKLSQSVQSPGPSLERSTKSNLHPSRIALGSPDIKDGWVCWGKSHAFRIPCAARAESMMPVEDRDTTTNKRQSNS